MVEIRDPDRLAATPRETALSCVAAGIDAAMPGPAVRDAVSLDGEILSIGGESFDLADRDRVLVVGGGKASVEMARALAGILGDRIDEGAVVTDAAGDDRERGIEGAGGRDGGNPLADGRVEVVPASHPVPDRREPT